MSELPHILPGHAPLDVCHKTHSGVAHHMMPGCECDGPTEMVKLFNDKGQVTHAFPVKTIDRVDIHDANGERRTMTIAEAKNAGLIT